MISLYSYYKILQKKIKLFAKNTFISYPGFSSLIKHYMQDALQKCIAHSSTNYFAFIMYYSELLEKIRLFKGLSQTGVAMIIGMTQQAYSKKILTGNVDENEFELIRRKMNCSDEELALLIKLYPPPPKFLTETPGRLILFPGDILLCYFKMLKQVGP